MKKLHQISLYEAKLIFAIRQTIHGHFTEAQKKFLKDPGRPSSQRLHMDTEAELFSMLQFESPLLPAPDYLQGTSRRYQVEVSPDSIKYLTPEDWQQIGRYAGLGSDYIFEMEKVVAYVLQPISDELLIREDIAVDIEQARFVDVFTIYWQLFANAAKFLSYPDAKAVNAMTGRESHSADLIDIGGQFVVTNLNP